MSNSPGDPIPVLDYAASDKKVYTCGTLRYTQAGLVTVFAWLLWGDFCFQTMETVAPSILPIKLKDLGASNTLMSVILTTLPMILNMTICPWVSFKSDRHRGRWGRRIPFILSTMPFLTISLVLLGWSESLATLGQRVLPPLAHMAPATVTIGVIAVLYVAFQFFNMFVGSVFWYLFNDVVPPQFLGRFMGLFRVFSSLSGFFFNFFIFGYANTRMREIFTGGAILYFLGFGAMCLFVKEGEYAPPPDEGRPKSFISDLKALGTQCFSSRFYWYFYVMNAFGWVAGLSGFASIFFSYQMGLTTDQVGKLNGIGAIATLCATYFVSVFVDRWHPLRISTYMAVFGAVTGFGLWIWIPVTLPGNVYFWLSIGGMLVGLFGTCLSDACEIPLFMRLLPKSLYGQFSSANALIRSFARIALSVFAGLFLDLMMKLCHGDAGYRWMFLWPWVFNSGRAVFIAIVYREWKKLGGDENYRPPAPWNESGFEEVLDKVPSVPARPRAVMTSMWLSVAGCAVNVALVPIFMIFMRRYSMYHAWNWYAMYLLPAKIILTAAAYWQLVVVRRDIVAQEEGRATRYGLPHHGVLLVNAIQGLINFPVFWYQTVAMIRLHMERELILFGIATILTAVAGIVFVQIMRWIERSAEGPAEGSPMLLDDVSQIPA